MKILVTGGEGFVGRHVRRELLAQEHEVEYSVRPFNPDRPFVFDAFAGLRDTRRGLLRRKDPPTADLVIHAGARVGRERCAQDVRDAIEANVTSTVLLAEACAEAGKSLVYVSSVEVYDPRNIYALTKHWAEEACRLVLPTELLTIARLGMQYGPGARIGADTLTNFLRAAIKGEELRAYRDAWRSWTYVGDTARALALIAEASVGWREHGKHAIEPAIYNVDSKDRHMLYDVAQEVVELVGSGSVQEVSAPAGYSDIPQVSTQRLRNLGWEPRISLAEGMALTYTWLQTQTLAAA